MPKICDNQIKISWRTPRGQRSAQYTLPKIKLVIMMKKNPAPTDKPGWDFKNTKDGMN